MPSKFKMFKPRKRLVPKGKKKLATKQYVDSQIAKQRELKYLCTEVSATANDGNWVTLVDRVQDIDQGSTAADRDGNMIQQLGLRFRIQIATASDRAQSVRFIALEKKKSYSAVLQDLPGQGGAGVREMIGCFTPNMLSNYNVLVDKTYECPPRYNGTNVFRHIFDDLYIKRNKRLQYEGSAGSTLELGKVSLYCVSDNLAPGATWSTVAVDAITYFKEI